MLKVYSNHDYCTSQKGYKKKAPETVFYIIKLSFKVAQSSENSFIFMPG